MVGMLGAKALELFGGAAVLEAASRVHVGQHDYLFRAQYLRRLGHELDAAKSDHVGVGVCRLARQLQRIADKIGEILNLGLLVIMREDHGVSVLAQPVDLSAQVETRKIFTDGSSHGLSLSWRLPRASYTASPCRAIRRISRQTDGPRAQ